MAFSFALLPRLGRTAPDTSIPSSLIPYAEELRELRSELDAKLDAMNHCDPEMADACIHEMLAAEHRMQVLLTKAQREDEIQRLERKIAALWKSHADADDRGARALESIIHNHEQYLSELRERPIAPIDPVEARRGMLAHLFPAAVTEAHP